MESLSMCRICLATDVRLCSIASHLRDMYERITSITFQREDRRPLVACYICHARLQNCYRLRTSCLRSEELLTEIISSGVLTLQDELSRSTLSVVSVLHLSLGSTMNRHGSPESHVKEESLQLDQQRLKDAEDITLEIEDITIEENELGEYQCSLLTDCKQPKNRDLNNTIPRTGVRVWKKPKTAALGNTEGVTTNNCKVKVVKKATKSVNIKELKIVTKKKPINTSKIFESSDKLNINLNKCKNFVSFVSNNVSEEISEKSTIVTSLENNVSCISSSKVQFSCDYCKKCFRHKDYLKNHIRMHTGENPYQCNVCKKCFTLKSHLRRHVLIHATDTPYQCNICKVFLTQNSNLKRHMRIHSDDKPFQCNICNKCFNERGYFQKHIRTHTSNKPYQCNVCQLFYCQKYNLQKHMRSHTGEKPFQCNICNKCFSDKSELKRHMRTHTGEKPFQCNICNKCFSEKGDLNRHIRIHTGEKPYQCHVCKKCFTLRGHLQSHILTHNS